MVTVDVVVADDIVLLPCFALVSHRQYSRDNAQKTHSHPHSIPLTVCKAHLLPRKKSQQRRASCCGNGLSAGSDRGGVGQCICNGTDRHRAGGRCWVEQIAIRDYGTGATLPREGDLRSPDAPGALVETQWLEQCSGGLLW